MGEDQDIKEHQSHRDRFARRRAEAIKSDEESVASGEVVKLGDAREHPFKDALRAALRVDRIEAGRIEGDLSEAEAIRDDAFTKLGDEEERQRIEAFAARSRAAMELDGEVQGHLERTHDTKDRNVLIIQSLNAVLAVIEFGEENKDSIYSLGEEQERELQRLIGTRDRLLNQLSEPEIAMVERIAAQEQGVLPRLEIDPNREEEELIDEVAGALADLIAAHQRMPGAVEQTAREFARSVAKINPRELAEAHIRCRQIIERRNQTGLTDEF